MDAVGSLIAVNSSPYEILSFSVVPMSSPAPVLNVNATEIIFHLVHLHHSACILAQE